MSAVMKYSDLPVNDIMFKHECISTLAIMQDPEYGTVFASKY